MSLQLQVLSKPRSISKGSPATASKRLASVFNVPTEVSRRFDKSPPEDKQIYTIMLADQIKIFADKKLVPVKNIL